jgi:hypothetical protein
MVETYPGLPNSIFSRNAAVHRRVQPRTTELLSQALQSAAGGSLRQQPRRQRQRRQHCSLHRSRILVGDMDVLVGDEEMPVGDKHRVIGDTGMPVGDTGIVISPTTPHSLGRKPRACRASAVSISPSSTRPKTCPANCANAPPRPFPLKTPDARSMFAIASPHCSWIA